MQSVRTNNILTSPPLRAERGPGGEVSPAFISLCIFIFVSLAFSSDYLIISKPSALSILNKYEQACTPEEKLLFVPGVAVCIEKNATTLGDQITPATRVSLFGKTFYFQKKSDSEALPATAGIQKISGDPAKQDSFTTTKNNCISIQRNNGNPEYLPAGATILPIFSSGARTYTMVISPRIHYGWINALPASCLQTASTKNTSTPMGAISDELTQRIQKVFDEANTCYTNYFTYFNKLTNAQKIIPVWKNASSENNIAYTLVGSKNSTHLLESSTAVLLQELKGIVLGKQVSVEYRNGTIAIVQNSQIISVQNK